FNGHQGRQEHHPPAGTAGPEDAHQARGDLRRGGRALSGFSEVTTLEIADRADVASGTVFRYAASKHELLTRVFNDLVREAVSEGRRRAERESSVDAAVFASVAPLLDSARQHPENTAVYQREILFGETAEKFRTEGLEIIADLEDSIARRLVDGLGVPVTAAGLAASSIFAATLVAIARVSTGMRADRDAHEDLALQVAQIVAGACSDVGRPTVVSDHPHGRSNDE